MKDWKTKIKNLFLNKNKYVHIFVWVLNIILIVLAFVSINDCSMQDNTAYAYDSGVVNTLNYNQLHGVYVLQSGSTNLTKYFDSTVRGGSYSTAFESGSQYGLLYINLPVTYIECGTQTLRTEFEPSDRAQTEGYSITLNYGITYPVMDGDTLYFRSVDNLIAYTVQAYSGWFREWLSVIEDLHSIPSFAMYRIDFFELIVDCTEDAPITTNFSIQYRNSSTTTFNDFVFAQRQFVIDYREFLTASVVDIAEDITNMNNNFLNIQLLPDFTVGNLILIAVTIPLVWAILKFFLGG